jgi:predicted Zn-dependent protease with MMP-like domain
MVSDGDWDEQKAPSIEAMEALAEAAFARLPDTFRALCKGIVFRVTDFPSDDVLKEMRCESEFDLLGLFSGVGLPQDSATGETLRLPNQIFLYRRPILDYWAEHDETLGAIVAHVLIHEIGHHFGMSDADMEYLESIADSPGPNPA